MGIRRSSLAACAIVLVAACVGMSFLAGCHDSFNPFSDELYLDTDVPKDDLREIDPIDLNAYREEGASEEQSGVSVTEEGVVPDYSIDMDLIEPPDSLDLSIEDARAMALQYNLDLQVELINPTIARESITQAEAAFESLFFANGSYSKTDTPTASALSGSQTKSLSGDLGVNVPLRTGGSLTFDLPINRFETDNTFSLLNPAYTTDFSISVSQPLLRNAGVRTNTYAIRIATYQAKASEAQAKLQVIRVLASVDRAYWRLYAARRALEVRKGEYDLAVAQLERAKRLVEQGVAAEVEVIRAESGVAERLEGIIVAENTVRDYQRDLKRIINKPDLDMGTPTILVPTTEPNPVRFKLDPQRLNDIALDERMEMLELELQLAQNISAIDLRRNQVLPIVNLDYTYNINGLGSSYNDAFDMLADRSFADHRFGLRVEVPLGNEAAQSNLRQALLARLQTLASKENRISFIRQEIFNATDQIETTWQRVLASRQNSILASRTVAAEERQFDLGLRTSTDVLDAQTRLADAQLAEIRALTEYEIAQVDLAVATGMTLGASKVRWDPIEPELEPSMHSSLR